MTTHRHPWTTRRTEHGDLVHLQERLADATRRASEAERTAAGLHKEMQRAERATAAYPGLKRQNGLLRAELVRVGALLSQAAGHVRGDHELVRSIRAALDGARAATEADSPAAEAPGVGPEGPAAQGG